MLQNIVSQHHVILVPGFFGFGSFGAISYFHGVRQVLEQSFERLGLSVTVTEVATLPTASIRVRAARVREVLAQVCANSEGPIHIIGHSTGGLDARLAIAPTASLPSSVRFEAYERVLTLVTVCCPHFGSPVATFFTSGMGRRLLRWIAGYLIWVLRRGRLPLRFALRIGYWVVRLWDPFRRRPNTFDELYAKLLNDLSKERRAELTQFLKAVSSDQALIFQLTPAGCDLLNACTADPDVRYGSVVARAPGGTLRGWLRNRLDLYAQTLYPAYAWLHAIAARQESRSIPEAVGAQRARLTALFGELPAPGDNDGVVPTNSQIWGELVHATVADHLDVVGHFGGYDPDGPSGDWIPSHAGFDRARFERLWGEVAAFITNEADHQVASDGSENVGQERTERDLINDAPPNPARGARGSAPEALRE